MPTMEHERALKAAGCRVVAGVDEAGRGPLVAGDGALDQRLRQQRPIHLGTALQQGEPQGTEPMGTAAHQQIARTAVLTPNRQRLPCSAAGQAAQGGDRQHALHSRAAVAPQEHASIALETGLEAAVDPLHPRPAGLSRAHQPHRDPLGFPAAHGGQVGEVGGCGPPAHVESAGGGIAEVNPVHQHIGIHHQRACGPEQGGIIEKLIRRGEGCQALNQLPFPQLRQAGIVRRRSHQPWARRFSAPSSTVAFTIASSTPSSSSTSKPSTT